MLSKTKNKGCSANCSKFSCQMLLCENLNFTGDVQIQMMRL